MKTFVIMAVLLLGARLVCAQEAKLPEGLKATTEMTLEEQKHFKDIAGLLRCPTCTGLSVLDSEAAFSLQIQALVKEQIKQGKDDDAILGYFTERYGPWILREPPKEGINWFAWIFPIALMLLGPMSVWVFVWRRKTPTTGGSMRSRDDILAEFESALAAMKAKGGRA